MNRPRLTSPLLIIITLSTFGCLELPEVTEVGLHVAVAADPGLELCAGTLAHMDEFVSRLSAEFQIHAPPTGDDRFTFYWLERDGFHERSGCPDTALACARDGDSFSPVAPINHELVHNVSHVLGHPLPLFTEGLAVAYEGLGASSFPTAPIDDVREFLGFTTGSQLGAAGGYTTAGAFTTYLIGRHGLGDYLKMYAAMGYFETIHGVDQIFRDVYGVSLEASIVDFEALAENQADNNCTEGERGAKLIECSAPELEWQGGQIALHRAIACEQADAVGPFGGHSVVVFHTFTVPEAGDYTLQVLGDDPGSNQISIYPCTICVGKSAQVRVGGPPKIVSLAAGLHSLRLYGTASAPTSLGLRIAPVVP